MSRYTPHIEAAGVAPARAFVISAVVAIAFVTGSVAGPVPPDADPRADSPDVLPRVLKRLQDDRTESRRWSYVESVVLEKRSADGGIRSRTTEVYEVFFKDGRPMERPLSVDLAQDSQGFGIVRREEARFIPTGSRDGDHARPEKATRFEVERLISCFSFEPKGVEDLAGRPAIRLGFKPAEGCIDDGSRAGRLLQNLSGILWVDARDEEIVRIEGNLESPVTFGFGLLGKVEKLDLVVEREPVAPGFYALTHVNYRARGTSFIFHHFDVGSVRDRSAFTRTGDHSAAAAPDHPASGGTGTAAGGAPGGSPPPPR